MSNLDVYSWLFENAAERVGGSTDLDVIPPKDLLEYYNVSAVTREFPQFAINRLILSSLHI